MSHKNPIRKDKTCLNCNYVVADRFCPNCGQENIETRKTFHHLFLHFFEDLTHYENAFWKTIKNLILHPASLTREYLSGKRMSYLAPVRLYIFISFITFFLIAIIPNDDKAIKFSETKGKGIHIEANDNDEEESTDSIKSDKKQSTLSSEELKIIDLKKKGFLSKNEADSISQLIKVAKKEAIKNKDFVAFGHHSVREMDSIRKVNPEEISDFEYWINKKTLDVFHNNTKEELIEKAKESATHNLPKVLLIYMPLFAFFLWLFHNKKKWFYFDHGIFTLHYFSFLLLFILILFLASRFFYLFGNNSVITLIHNIIKFAGLCWMVYYFFPAHHRFYGETRSVSFIKSTVLFFINIFFIIILLTIFLIYTLITIH